MRRKVFLLLLAGMLAWTGWAEGQPLPKVALRPLFAAFAPQLPVCMIEAPDGSGRWFLVEQGGQIFVIPKGTDGSQAREFLNITNRNPHSSYEQGLLSMACHPGFKTNGLFYIYYSQQDPRRSVISEWKVAATDANRADMHSERVVLEVPQQGETHKAGLLCFGPDGCLYIGSGDGSNGFDPANSGQNTATLLGKILRIDVNARSTVNKQILQYGIPADNPFAGEPEMNGFGARHEIWAYGLRNPWRYSFDSKTGELWAGDVGQDLWEEVDLIVKGGNYGWCVREGAHAFKPGPPGAQYIEPVMEYPHNAGLLPQSLFPEHSIGAAVIGGYVYHGKKFPALEGVYVYGDFALGTIWGFRYVNGKVTRSATLLEQPKNISSFAEDADGELYALTMDATAGDGIIYSIIVP